MNSVVCGFCFEYMALRAFVDILVGFASCLLVGQGNGLQL